jgi:type I restriction enzyme S subunit
LDFQAYSDKAAVPGLNRNHLHLAEVRVPTDIAEQRAIARILGTLDDKIELNRRMNETVQAIARTIFKSWFVDFEAVRAKASGEPPESICRRLGLTLELLALFPDGIGDSELGEIPEGWGVTTLGELCERVSMGPFGSDIKTSNFVPEGVPIIRGGNLTAGFIEDKFVFLTETKADELRNANARAGDIVITHRGTLGQVGIIPTNSRYPRYVVSQSQMVLTVKKERTTSRFIYEFLCSPIGQQALLANTSQVGVPAIARPTTSVKAISLVAPPPKLLQAFDMVVGPLFDYMQGVSRESSTLAILRDTLLPKLLSGELPVPVTGVA